MAQITTSNGNSWNMRDLLNEYFGFGGAAGGGNAGVGTGIGGAAAMGAGAVIGGLIGNPNNVIENNVGALVKPGQEQTTGTIPGTTETKKPPLIIEVPGDVGQSLESEKETMPNGNNVGAIPNIEDKTEENQNVAVNGTSFYDIYKLIQEDQKARWEREDQIRKEIQLREDNAWQRSIYDAEKAGINPNLININPASSGGGITQATGIDYSTLAAQMNNSTDELQQMIDNAFKGNENEKDRFMDTFSQVLSVAMQMLFLKGLK